MEQITVARSRVYGLLARLLLGEWESLTERFQAEAGERAGDTALGQILQGLARVDPFELKVEHDNLFVVPGKYYVPPFERYYLKEGSDTVDKIYEPVQFSYPLQRGELPDHLGCELAFMQSLVLAENGASKDGNTEAAQMWSRLQNDFLHKHLSAWIGDVCRAVSEKAPGGFYADVLHFAAEFVQSETTELRRE